MSEPVTAMVVEKSVSESWAACAVSMQGWRKTHEDEHILQCASTGTEECGVFAVLDGHGGQTAASIGSVALKELLGQIAQHRGVANSDAEKELQDAFFKADARLREELSSDDRSGTTVVAAIVTCPTPGEFCVQLAHCGDSRAVLRSGHRLICSSDHKPQREDETKRIQAAGGTVEHGPLGGGPLRVDGALAVSRALGDFHFKPAELDPAKCKVTAMPEISEVKVCHKGDWLLLACDGVFDVMENEDVDEFISSRLQKAPSAPADGGQVLTELLQTCLDKGSKDNCTACLVQFVKPGSLRPTPGPERKLLQGAWDSASPDVQEKYAEFFEAHGFEAEAKALRKKGGRSSAASSRGGPPRSASPPRASGSAPAVGAQRQIVALAKAMQAMRSSRKIQAAWRARRGSKGDGEGDQDT